MHVENRTQTNLSFDGVTLHKSDKDRVELRKSTSRAWNQTERNWLLFGKNSSISTRTLRDEQGYNAKNMGNRRKLMAPEAKNAFVHADALIET